MLKRGRIVRGLVVMGVVLMGLAAATGESQYGRSSSAISSRGEHRVSVKASSHPQLGNVVTDGEGRTLYIFLRDEPGEPSVCEGPCADRWPPLVVDGEEVPTGMGIRGQVGLMRRADGRVQLTYEGLPLYYWHQDSQPGDAKGQGVGGVWFVVPADPLTAAPPTIEVAQHGELGEYLVDTYGRSLYMFTRDEGEESACYDQCAQNWPPVMGRPAPSAKVTAPIGTTTRTDGNLQASAAGMPLYYFAGDSHPGQINGQGFRDVWYILAPDGTVIGRTVDQGEAAAGTLTRAGVESAGTVEVAIRGFTFQPEELTVQAGTTVVWTNADAVTHTVTSAGSPRTLDSPLLNRSGRFSFTFTEPGRYDYFCTVHPGMKGTVLVQ